MPVWVSYGLNSFTLNMQGGSPTGYGNKAWANSAYTASGNLKPDYLQRLTLILDEAQELEMVVILGYFYFGQDQNLEDEAAVINAVDQVTDWLLENGYRNVLVEINNECDIQAYQHEILTCKRVHELITRVQSRQRNGHSLLASTSFAGGVIPGDNVVEVADFVLLHGNGVDDPATISDMVRRTRNLASYSGQPVVFNEDDHYGFGNEANNYKAAIESYAGWGYFDFRRAGETDMSAGFQSVPVDWGVNHARKQAFFDYTRQITGKLPGYSIENTVNTFNKENIEKTEVGYQYWFADKTLADGKTLKLSVVKPHEATHAPHEHTEDEFFFVLEGTAEFHLDGKTAVGGPMTSFYCPPGVKHGIRNIGDTELKYLVIKQYILE